MSQLGPNQPGQVDPETGEMPLYQRQLDELPGPEDHFASEPHSTAGPYSPPHGYEAPDSLGNPYSPPHGLDTPDALGTPTPYSPPHGYEAPDPFGNPYSPPHGFEPPDPYDPGPGPADDWTAPVQSPAALGLATTYADPALEQELDEILDEAPEDIGKKRPVTNIPKLPYLSGIDGLRGLALLAIMAFNAEITQVQGGFLGISTAFTLGGFLLTTMMLAEWAQRGRLSLTELWTRRAGRIVPPQYAMVALVIVLQLAVRVGSVPTFRRDVWGSLGFVTNWQLAYPPDGFARSFSELSALKHLWPVAIAVQLTVLLPVVFAGLMAVTSHKWRTAGVIFSLMAALSFLVAASMSDNPRAHDIVTYGTHTRAGELLVGVVLAYLVLTPSFRTLINRPRVLELIRHGGVVATVGLLGLWTLVSTDSSLLFRGGTALNALLTAWIVLAVTMPGMATTTLGLWPLRKLGEISFCAYLLHWPLFLLLNEDRTNLDDLPLFVVRVAATIVAATVLMWTVESTFRWRLELGRLQLPVTLGVAAAAMAVAAAVLPVNPPANISLTVDDGSGPGDLDVVVPSGGSEVARVLVVGDESAASVVGGFEQWNSEHIDAQLRVDTHVADDCPLGGAGALRRLGQEEDPTLDCEAWRFRLPEMLDAAEYDAVVVLMGAADLGDREIDREWRHLGDPAYDRWMADQIGGLADVVAEADAPVVWLTTPHVRQVPEEPSDGDDWTDFDDNDPARVDRLNALILAGVGDRDGFEVADLDAWLHDQPQGEFNPELRDATEFTETGAGTVATWLAENVVETTEAESSE